MQVGDKRQAGILGTVAVGAVAFLIFQLVPKADAHQAALPAKPPISPTVVTDAPAPVAPVPAVGAGVPLQRDPFAVVRHAAPKPSVVANSGDPSDAADAKGDAADAKGTTPASSLLPPGPIGSFSGIASPEEETPDPGMAVPPAVKKGRPAPKAVGKTALAPPVAPPKIAVALLGVVEMPTPIAMVRVGTAERTLRIGDEVAPGLRIAAITLEGITFVNRPGVCLALGEETNL